MQACPGQHPNRCQRHERDCNFYDAADFIGGAVPRQDLCPSRSLGGQNRKSSGSDVVHWSVMVIAASYPTRAFVKLSLARGNFKFRCRQHPRYEPTSIFETLCRPPRTMAANRKKRRSRHVAAFWAALRAGHARLRTTMGMPQIKSNRGHALLCAVPAWLTGSLPLDQRPLFRLDNFFSYLSNNQQSDSSTLRLAGKHRHGGLNQRIWKL